MSKLIISTGGAENLDNACSLLADAFEIDPVITYLLQQMSHETRVAYLPSYFRSLLTAATMNRALITEAGGWKCCGVLMPPKCRVDNPWTIIQAGFFPMLWRIGFGACQRMMLEYTSKADAVKAKGLKGIKKYYYVFFLGTLEGGRGNGFGTAIVKEWQKLASKDRMPIWLEATTEDSRRLYERLGFKTVESMVLGKGKSDEKGLICKGGEEVKIWAMVWWPVKS